MVYSKSNSRLTFRFCLSTAAVCLLAAIVVISRLDYESMWIDEAMTLATIRAGFPALLKIVAADVHPPIFFLWVYLWHLVTGSDSLFILRLSSAIPAVITIAICYRLGIEWFGSRLAGFAAAIFLATSGIFVYYSRDLRMYPLTVMLITFSWWMLTRMIKGKHYGLWGYAIALILMAYTYYYTGFMAFIQFLFVFVFFRNKLRQFIIAGVVAGIAFAPYISTLLEQLRIAKAQSGSDKGPIIGKFLGTIPTSWNAISEFITTYTAKQSAYILLLLALAIVLGLSLQQKGRKWLGAAILWFFGTAILFFTLNLVIPIYGLRYVLMIIPGLALLVGCAVSLLPTMQMRVVALLVVLSIGLIDHTDGFLPPRAPHRELLSTISAHALPTDTVWYNLTLGALGSTITDDVKYHLQQDAPNLNTDIWVWGAPQEYIDPVKTPRVWDVRPYWIPIPPQAEGPLIKTRTVTETYTFGTYTIKLYEGPPRRKKPVMVGDLFEVLPSPTVQPPYHVGDAVPIKTWWHILKQPSLDYSYNLTITSADAMDSLAQADAGLVMENEAVTDLPTSQWLPSDNFNYNRLTFTIPSTLVPGKYRVWLAVYFYADGKRLPVTASPDVTTDDSRSNVLVGAFEVK